MPPLTVDETIRLDLPVGFAVDELPAPSSVDEPFGRYSLSFAVEGQRLIVRRTLSVRQSTVPPAGFAALRSFLDRVRAADTTPAVLARRPR